MVAHLTPAPHPIRAAAATAKAAFKDVRDVQPVFMSPADQETAVRELAELEAMVAEARLRVVAAAQDTASRAGARDLGAWLSTLTLTDFNHGRADACLAEALDRRWSKVAAGMADGSVSADQAQVVVHALDALPKDLDPELVAKAEQQLVDYCKDFRPRDLRRLGRRILEIVAPDIAEAEEAKRLEDEERRAREKCRLVFKPIGDGTTRLTGVLPDLDAHRLRTYLDAFTSPRKAEHAAGGEEDRIPYPRRLGHAFCALHKPRCWYHASMTATAADTLTAREYLRVSQDKSKRERSIEEQHADNERAAAARGVTLAEPYRDKPMSASRYGTKTRDAFARLLDDLEQGRFDANELWLWEPSRGSRKVSEWARLVEACEAARVSIFVTAHRRVYDPSNGRDRRSLYEDANDSEYESSKVSDRVMRAVAANAEAGLPHGPTPYGYQRIYDPVTRRLVSQEPHPEEAPVVREAYDRFLGGESLYAIAKDFEGRGVATRKGKVITARLLRDILMSPTYAGWRTHRTSPDQPRWCLDGKVQGTWEPLVPEATYLTVRSTLEGESRRSTRPVHRAGKARHLLSFTAVCDVCEGPLVVTYRRGSDQYQCHQGGHVRIDKGELDALAEEVLLGFLSRKDAFQGMAAAETDGTKLRAVRADLTVARGELRALREGVAAGRLSVANLAVVEPRLLQRVEGLEAEERDLSTPSVLRGLFQPGPGARARWQAADPTTRRQVARLLLTPEHLGQLRVDRRPPGSGSRRIPARDRVAWAKAD
ncbi:hypothetical protein DJ010_20380 [Nocardioides silvaticus]|uniref:Recombinase domain-containing protein n=1 Tax=Nocardioides silvaticus TaxID=2201891 RepID=A0A316TBU2_9ACTN|nr:recombinase family protein [Nocardioides silvaticus]PWN00981.1 hypothetical protein DJ010_20380 [Nocardioides silvaticus]